jgi:hypothetical protein
MGKNLCFGSGSARNRNDLALLHLDQDPGAIKFRKINIKCFLEFLLLYTNPGNTVLKVPKCEIFDRSDFHDFYPIKSLWEGDFGVKTKSLKKNI